jgi:formylglycine-generating enzyme required for sulfatase activity
MKEKRRMKRFGITLILSLVGFSLILMCCTKNESTHEVPVEKENIPVTFTPSVQADTVFYPKMMETNPDGDLLFTLSSDGTLQVWEIYTGKRIRNIKIGEHEYADEIPNGANKDFSAVIVDDGIVEIWNKETLIQTLEVPYTVTLTAISRDGTKLFTASDDGVIYHYDIATGKEIAQYINFDDEWLSLVPSGYYNSSRYGSSHLTVQAGEDTYTLSQFAETLYRPDKFFEIASGISNVNKESGESADIPLSEFLRSENVKPPRVEILTRNGLSTPDAETLIEIKLTEEDGGIGYITLYNGEILKSLVSLEEADADHSRAGGKNVYTVSIPVMLDAGVNRIAVAAFNSEGNMESEKVYADITSTRLDDAAEEKPVLHVLVSAIKEYENPLFNLKYTINDAEELRELFSRQSEGTLYSDVKIHTLYNSEVTKEGFAEKFDEIKEQVDTKDTFIFFFAGHGAADDRGDFFLYSYDTLGTDESADRNIRKQDIVANLLKIPAENALVLLDTCQSGAILEMETAFGRLLEKLDQKAFLAAALGDQFSHELDQLEHGVFTYSLSKGLRSDREDDRYIGIMEIIDHVQNDIPQLLSELAEANENLEVTDDTDRAVVVTERLAAEQNNIMQEPMVMKPNQDFSIIDLYLDPGVLEVTSHSTGTLMIVGSEEEEAEILPTQTKTYLLKEGSYQVVAMYSDGYRETQDVVVRNNGKAEIAFTYEMPLPLRVIAKTIGRLEITGDNGFYLQGFVRNSKFNEALLNPSFRGLTSLNRNIWEEIYEGTMVTPFSTELLAGTYTVKMTYIDGHSESRTVDIAYQNLSQPFISFNYVIPFGSLTIRTITNGILDIQGAGFRQRRSIFVGTPLSLSNLKPNTYTVKITYPDGHTETQDVTIRDNGDHTVLFGYIIPATGSLTISTITAGSVTITGENFNHQEHISEGKSFTLPEIKQGNYTVEMIYEGRIAERKEINIFPNRNAKVDFSYRTQEAKVIDNMVLINGGTFMMGSPSSEVGRDDDEVQHQVTVSGFYMGKYEVTQEEYQAVMGTNPAYFKGADFPVEQMSWYDAVEYCNALSVQEGLTPAYTINGTNVTWNRNANGYRLPTEAEWEYACRSGTTTPFSTGNNITTNQANYDGNYPYNGNTKGTYRERTTAVGSFPPNAWGLYDMHGNLWEWCWDWNGNYSRSTQTDPLGPSSGTVRVARGGSWGSRAMGWRSADRYGHDPTAGIKGTGFRVVRNAPAK